MTIPSSIHLFNSSGGDEGFQYLYMCGTVFLGILAALRQERAAQEKQRRDSEAKERRRDDFKAFISRYGDVDC